MTSWWSTWSYLDRLDVVRETGEWNEMERDIKLPRIRKWVVVVHAIWETVGVVIGTIRGFDNLLYRQERATSSAINSICWVRTWICTIALYAPNWIFLTRGSSVYSYFLQFGMSYSFHWCQLEFIWRSHQRSFTERSDQKIISANYVFREMEKAA
jgi:hypothetical protein